MRTLLYANYTGVLSYKLDLTIKKSLLILFQNKIMEKEIIVGGHVLIMRAHGRYNVKVCKKMCGMIFKIEKRLKKIMKRYRLPSQIFIQFKSGDETLDGFYHVEPKKVAKNITAIDIFTKQLRELEKAEGEKSFEINLVDTLIHELVHNKVKEEKKTRRIVKAYMKKNKDKILSELSGR